MYSFALRPRWLLSHLVVLALVVLMVNLGFWQLRRLDDRQANNALLEQRIDQPPVAFSSIVAGSVGQNGLRFTPTTVTGRFDERTVLVDNRTLDGAPGYWLVTPLRDDTGSLVAIARGFVNRATIDGADADSFAVGASLGPPSGIVTVEGYIEDASPSGQIADGGDEPIAVNKIAPDSLFEIFGTAFDPYYVVADQPATATIFAIPQPPTGNGSHLGYAVQWFVFSTIAAVGYGFILRRQAVSPQHDAEPDAGKHKNT